MAPRRSSRLPAAILCGMVGCMTLAADAPGDPLHRLRAEWKTQVNRETKNLRERYVQNLLTLEKDLVKKGDYAAAARARLERRQILPSGESPDPGTPAVPPAVTEGQPVVLEAANAILSPGLTFNAATGVLSGWSVAGAMAAWLLPPGLKAGGYEVELTYSCQPESGGEFTLKEDRYYLRRTVKPTSSWDLYQTEVVGTLRLIAGSHLLELSSAAVKGADLMHLKSVRLLPANGRN